jgi:hypothetical protein
VRPDLDANGSLAPTEPKRVMETINVSSWDTVIFVCKQEDEGAMPRSARKAPESASQLLPSNAPFVPGVLFLDALGRVEM